MRDDRPSSTAIGVCLLRGIASLPSDSPPTIDDPFASVLLPRRSARALELAGVAAQRNGRVRAALLSLATPFGRHIELRTAAIDAAVTEAVAAGNRQLVIVGAGLDARAWRLAALAGLAVWEVDHPATQRYKRARAAGLVPRARSVSFVEVDFERETLDLPLERAGHDAGQPSVWIWEGVTPYLNEAAIESTLDRIAARSAAGSRLIMSYARPDYTNVPSFVLPAARAAFSMVGEPLRGAMSREAVVALLERAGFNVLEEHGALDWAARFGVARPRIVIHERLIIAERSGTSGTSTPQ